MCIHTHTHNICNCGINFNLLHKLFFSGFSTFCHSIKAIVLFEDLSRSRYITTHKKENLEIVEIKKYPTVAINDDDNEDQ